MDRVKVATTPLREFSAKDLETIYISAYHLYQKGNYSKAAELFLQLITANPYEQNFWKGLASCYQMQSAWDPALHAWAMCALLNPSDPYPHYHAAECLYAKKDPSEAMKAIAKARDLTSNDAEPLKQKLNLLEEFCTQS